MSHLVVVGGSDAGISAALRAREIAPAVEATVVVADRFPNYSVCGLPFYLSGEIPDWQALAHRSAEEIERAGVRLLLEAAAEAVDPVAKTVTVASGRGQSRLPYDQLVIATGAVPVRPPIRGIDLPGVFFLRSMANSFAVHNYLATRAPLAAVVVGGGYIGLEMADALTRRGLAVTVVEHGASVLKTVDPSLGTLVDQELRRHGVRIATGVAVEAVDAAGGRLRVSGSREFAATVDLVLVAVGVTPATELARSAGVALGQRGAIRVTRTMATNVPEVFAAGDCVESWHRLLSRPTYLPLGTTAHKQGRVAGENAVGSQSEFAGSLGTQVVKVFDLAVARTGLRDGEAREAGFDPHTVELTAWDRNAYYPGARELRVRVTGDRRSGRLLGAQLVGHWQAGVAKRADIFAAALFHGMSVEAMSDLDLSYTPPLSRPWDPVQAAAQAWMAGLHRLIEHGRAPTVASEQSDGELPEHTIGSEATAGDK